VNAVPNGPAQLWLGPRHQKVGHRDLAEGPRQSDEKRPTMRVWVVFDVNRWNGDDTAKWITSVVAIPDRTY
jgi:hypothetical protein